MARPALHSVDGMLDAARGLLLAEGVEQTTIQAIAAASGAPVGSLYNRFGSRAGLLARLWLRAAMRSQAACLPALDGVDALEAALEVVRRLLDFARLQADDARLLASCRREDLLGASPQLNAELEQLNAPVERAIKELARRLFGSARGESVRRVRLAMLELPLAAVRSYLLAGRTMPEHLDAHVLRAARAVLTD
jgi:AcrR family transcriptional regulator